MAENVSEETGSGGNFFFNFCSELVSSPLNLALLGLCAFLLYKIIVGQRKPEPLPPREPELPKLKKQDMTLEQLREYDGKGEDGRILIAANGKIFDVTRGKRFYGPGIHQQGRSLRLLKIWWVGGVFFSLNSKPVFVETEQTSPNTTSQINIILNTTVFIR